MYNAMRRGGYNFEDTNFKIVENLLLVTNFEKFNFETSDAK